MTQVFLSNHVNPTPPVPVSASRRKAKAQSGRLLAASKQLRSRDPRFAVEQTFAVGHLILKCILHMYLNLAPVAAKQGDGGDGGAASEKKCRLILPTYHFVVCLFAFFLLLSLWTSNY